MINRHFAKPQTISKEISSLSWTFESVKPPFLVFIHAVALILVANFRLKLFYDSAHAPVFDTFPETLAAD